jgi:hypothetical protein
MFRYSIEMFHDRGIRRKRGQGKIEEGEKFIVDRGKVWGQVSLVELIDDEKKRADLVIAIALPSSGLTDRQKRGFEKSSV